ncbi:hypothetical protein FRB97_000663 [Tulasnella sp. 331]|nr:hypothetical protein FRB97_000663 [Tulasnella sp. 331]
MDIPLFGSKRDFWAKYDAFSFTFDKDMMERLNTNLDVMLIFAGLFSAINTAFIVVALTALSANPADETNHLLRLLVLTLCCSLLTAGAVLAKQWLQLYERAGQTGPIDQQALRRTEKFAGAEKWGLHPVVETLATLLLVSLALFFIALTDYLWTVEKKVALRSSLLAPFKRDRQGHFDNSESWVFSLYVLLLTSHIGTCATYSNPIWPY